MTRKQRRKSNPIEHEIELALNPGAFIPDRACFSFVCDLDEVAAKIARLVSSNPAQAATLYETFLAACYEKIEELDDSSGSFAPSSSTISIAAGSRRARPVEPIPRRPPLACSPGSTRMTTASATGSRWRR